MFFDFIKDLLSRWKFWIGIVAFIASLSGTLKIPASVTAFLALMLAFYDVWQSQQKTIGRLSSAQATGKASLIIDPEQATLFAEHSSGTFILFDMTIENKGDRNAIIRKYGIEADGQSFQDITPNLRIQTVMIRQETTTVNYSLPTNRITNDGVIEVEAKGRKGPGTLLFHLPDFFPKGDTLHCTLKLVDTYNESFHGTFEVGRARI